MLPPTPAGGPRIPPTAPAPLPPVIHQAPVASAVQRTTQAANFGPEPDHAAAYQIKQTLSDPNLTRADKGEYIARLVEQTRTGDPLTADAIRRGFEDIGEAWSGAETPELRAQVADAIGREVNSGRLSGDDLYSLVDAKANPYSDGARALLGGVRDGVALNRVADRLLTDAQAAGYDINKYQNGPALLAAAADVANMAAANGSRASATAVLQEVGRVSALGPVAGDMSLVQAMRLTTSQGSFGLAVAGHSGNDALSQLINTADTSSPALRATADSLFATLVRTGDGTPAGLASLSTYFSANLPRLNEAGWRYDSLGGASENLVQDFVAKVLLNPATPAAAKDAATGAIGREVNRLASVVQDSSAAAADRRHAATSLGEMVGSIKGGANDFYANGKASNDAKIAAIRFFSDQLTGKLSAAAGPFGKLVDAGVDAGWNAASGNADSRIDAAVREALGPLEAQTNQARAGIGDLNDADLANAYDGRYTEHAPDK